MAAGQPFYSLELKFSLFSFIYIPCATRPDKKDVLICAFFVNA